MAVITSKLIVSLIDQLTGPARGIAQTVKNLQAQSRANAVQMDAMRGRMVDAAAAAWALGKALADPVQKAVAFESAMADVAKVSDFDPAGLAKFSQDLRRLATSEIPMAVTEMAALAENAAASGIADGDLLEFTRMTAKAALAWGVSGGQAGEDLAKIKEALRLNIDETMLYADAINHLSDRTASTAPDLTDFARRVAAQGEFFGFTREQSLAFGSAMISAGAPTEVAATSFRNMGRALTKGMSATPRVAKAYKKLGLDASKVAKGMQDDAVGTTMEVIKRLGQLPAEMQAATMGDLFGDEARALAPLLSNVELLERTMGYVADETQYAGSVQAEFARRAATTEFNLQRLKNQVDEVAMAIGNALLPAINFAAEAAGPCLQAMADWISANPQVVQAIVALVGGLVALRVMTIAARWAFLFLKGGLIDVGIFALRSAMLVAGAAGHMGRALAAARAAALGATMLASVGAGGLFSGVIAWLGGIGAAVAGAVAGITAPVWVLIALVVAALAAVGLAVWKFWAPISAFFSGFGEVIGGALAKVGETIANFTYDRVVDLATAFGVTPEQVAQTVETVRAALVKVGETITGFFAGLPETIGNWFGGLFTQVELTEEDEQGYRDMGKRLAEAILSPFTGFGQMIADIFAEVDWGKIGTDLMNAIWEGMKSIIPNMVAGIGAAFSNINLFGWGGGEPAAPAVDGARAAGGSIFGGRTYLVGEHGPKLVTPSRSGFVHNAADTAGMLGGRAGGSVSVSFGNIIVQGGSDPQATAEAVLHMLESRLKDALGGIYADIEYAGG